jgi:NaMN:DMB phosphoribosyltransferase
VVREGVGAGGEMTQALYAHINNKRKKILIVEVIILKC